MSYELNGNIHSWNDQLYQQLRADIKSHFNISGDFIIFDINNEVELEDIDDIKDEFESHETDDNFTYILQFNIVTENDNQNVTKSQSPQNILTMSQVIVDVLTLFTFCFLAFFCI